MRVFLLYGLLCDDNYYYYCVVFKRLSSVLLIIVRRVPGVVQKLCGFVCDVLDVIPRGRRHLISKTSNMIVTPLVDGQSATMADGLMFSKILSKKLKRREKKKKTTGKTKTTPAERTAVSETEKKKKKTRCRTANGRFARARATD